MIDDRIYEESSVSQVLRGGAATFMIKVGVAAAGICLHLYLAQSSGLAVYGRYTYVLAWVNLASVFATMGLDAAFVQRLPEYLATRKPGAIGAYVRGSVTAAVVSSAVLAGSTTLGLIGVMGQGELKSVALVGCLALPANVLLLLYSAAMQALGRPILSTFLRDFARIVLLLVFLVVVSALPHVRVTSANLMGAYVVVSLVLAIFGWQFAEERIPRIDRRKYSIRIDKEWLIHAIPFMAMSGLHLLMTRTDVLMLGWWRGTDVSGVYSAAIRVSTLSAFFMMAVNTVAAPRISALYAGGDTSALARMATWATWAMSGMALVVAVTTILLGRPVLHVFGPGFDDGYAALVALAVGQVLNSGMGMVGFMLTMTGNERVAAGSLCAATVLNVVLNLLLIPAYGLFGAAIATVVSKLLWNVGMSFYVRQRIGLNWARLLVGGYRGGWGSGVRR